MTITKVEESAYYDGMTDDAIQNGEGHAYDCGWNAAKTFFHESLGAEIHMLTRQVQESEDRLRYSSQELAATKQLYSQYRHALRLRGFSDYGWSITT